MTEAATLTMEKDHDLISSSRVEGTPVYNSDGEKLGSVKEVMINKMTGQVAYAVMSFGGFLGVGERYHPLPWGVLTFDIKKLGYQVNIDKEVLKNAPTHGPEDQNWYLNRAFENSVFQYYGVTPYWL